MGNEIRLLFAGGGTAGHLLPAINIAKAMITINKHVKPLFVGKKNGMEKNLVNKNGFDIEEINVIGMKRSFSGVLKFMWHWRTALAQSKSIIKRFDPHGVVGTGGYVSAPIMKAASRFKIPVFIQEQNSLPGLANRSLAKYADTIFTCYKSSMKYFPEQKCVNIGNPVRHDLIKNRSREIYDSYSLNPNKNTLLVTGGSSGARGINSLVEKLLNEGDFPGSWQILWQTGKNEFSKCAEIFAESDLRISVVPFIDDMSSAYSIADLIVSRAGAMAISEITALGIPSILIPYPHATGDHQDKNASELAKEGAAEIIRESDTYEKFPETVFKLLSDNGKRREMSAKASQLGQPDAALSIAKIILERINEVQTN